MRRYIDLEPVSVVLADDAPDMIDLLDRELSNDPRFEVVGRASDGEAAIREVEDKLPDVIVLDLGMPVMDGVHAISEISRRSPGTKILVLSSLPVQSEPLIDQGASAHVLKTDGLEAFHNVLIDLCATEQRVRTISLGESPSTIA
jgi:DNA-binding NarL/FixJ family response regulator